MHKRRKSDEGTAAVLVAMMIPVLLVGIGLVVDGGQALELKRRTQKAADAGAIAAAQELRRGNQDTYQAAVLKDAARNGFDAANAAIQVWRPPVHGKRAGDSNFVEVRVRSESDLFFMRGYRQEPIDVESFAISGIREGDACIFLMDPTGSRALWGTGDAKVDLGKCGIHVNSSSETAARTDGGAIIKASMIDVVGDYDGNGFMPTPLSGAPEEEDPWAHLQPPAVGKCTHTNFKVTKPKVTLDPGTYCGGIEISSDSDVTFTGGNYVLNGGGIKVSGGAKLRGDGVTFYLTEDKKFKYGGVDFVGTSLIDLKAPASGSLGGILFFQDRNIKTKVESKFAGTADSNLTGGLYFPTTTLKFVGNGSTNFYKLLAVADRAEFHGTINIEAPGPSSGLLTPNIIRASLVQ